MTALVEQKILLLLLVLSALLCPRFSSAENRRLEPGTHEITIGLPHRIMPEDLAREWVGCCDAGKEFEAKLGDLNRRLAACERKAEQKSNPGLSLFTGVAIAAVAFAGGVWVASRSD